MSMTLQQRFSNMTGFTDSYVENFICEFGLDETIDFLPIEYNKYKQQSDNALYCYPYTLKEILKRLKGFIGVNSFTTYTSNPIKQVTNTHNFIAAFLDVCSVRLVKSTITGSVSSSDISYITSNYDLINLDAIISNTKNVIIIENINRLDLIEKLEKYKRHHVVSYYYANNTTNPVTSVAIIYKDFIMF